MCRSGATFSRHGNGPRTSSRPNADFTRLERELNDEAVRRNAEHAGVIPGVIPGLIPGVICRQIDHSVARGRLRTDPPLELRREPVARQLRGRGLLTLVTDERAHARTADMEVFSRMTTSREPAARREPNPSDRLLGPDEVAAFLGVPLRTIYRWRSRHEGPRGYRVGRHVRYRLDDVERWLEDRSDAS